MDGYLQKTRFDWQFYAPSSSACLGRKDNCFWPRGRMLGGTSSLNGMVYVRGNAHNYNYWSKLGNTGWDYESVLAYFKKSEANQYAPFVSYANGRYHNAKGPIKVDFMGDLYPTDQIFIDAAAENGIPFITDINADNTTGYLNLQGTMANGRRQSSANRYLAPAKHRQNLKVIKHAFVTKILVDQQNRAHGVKFTYKGNSLRAFARKEIILSAGAVMSPIVLMYSGIGAQDQLQKHKIPVKKNLNGVGANLYDHLDVRLFFTFNPTETAASSDLDSVYQLAVHNSGPFVSMRRVGEFVNTRNNSKYPDIQVYQAYFTSNNPGFKGYLLAENFKDEIVKQLIELNRKRDVAVVFIASLQPKSHGYVKMNGSCSCNKPIIQANYYSNRYDMETMVHEAKRQISYTNTKAYRTNGGEYVWLPLKDCEQFELKSDAYLECHIRQFSSSAYHPVGTCKMGPKSDKLAVIDPDLKVHGIDRLRVIDASVYVVLNAFFSYFFFFFL